MECRGQENSCGGKKIPAGHDQIKIKSFNKRGFISILTPYIGKQSDSTTLVVMFSLVLLLKFIL